MQPDHEEPMGDAVGAPPAIELQPLASLAEGDDLVTARRVLLSNVDALAGAALARRTVSVRRNGAVLELADPDLNAALKAQELGARILGANVDKLELTERKKAIEAKPMRELAADALQSTEFATCLVELGWWPPASEAAE